MHSDMIGSLKRNIIPLRPVAIVPRFHFWFFLFFQFLKHWTLITLVNYISVFSRDLAAYTSLCCNNKSHRMNFMPLRSRFLKIERLAVLVVLS